MVLEGELVLVTDEGEQTMTPGMIAGFPAARPDGTSWSTGPGKTPSTWR